MHEVLVKLFKERNVKVLCKVLFGFDLAPTQVDIVRTIAFSEHKRICINAMTRYGKTRCVAMAILLYILMNPGKKNALVAPTNDQAITLRNYLVEMIAASPIFSELINRHGKASDINAESSRKRQTFKNGADYSVYSAEGKGDRLMSKGVTGILVTDEHCLVPKESEAKISRMLGDKPEETIWVCLANPWDRDTQYFKNWTNPKFKTFHVDWKIALAEGRTTAEYIEERRRDLTDLEFTVLFESKFPSQSDDALFNYDRVQEAINKFEDIKIVDIVIGADIADKGKNKTVFWTLHTDGYLYKVVNLFDEDKSENTVVAGRLIRKQEDEQATYLNIDCIGVGVGVVSMVKEGLTNKKAKVVACNFGGAPKDKKRFLNKKAEMYFRLNALINQGLISIPDHPVLIEQLISIKWEFTSSGKIKIIDPEKGSPDHADALVYGIWPLRTGYFIR